MRRVGRRGTLGGMTIGLGLMLVVLAYFVIAAITDRLPEKASTTTAKTKE